MSADFVQYTHIEESVEAVEFNAASAIDIIEALSKEASQLLLKVFQMEYDSVTGGYTVVFQYKNDSVPSAMTDGDYLVKLNSGNYCKMSKAEFEATYTA